VSAPGCREKMPAVVCHAPFDYRVEEPEKP
jgi:hypothetical protein